MSLAPAFVDKPRRPLVLPELLSPADRELLLSTTESLPARRVVCGDESVSWDERLAPADHPAAAFFSSNRIADLALAQFPRGAAIAAVTVWRSTYRAAEHIDRHTDRSGDIQLLAMLKPAPSDCGGAFCAEIGGRTETIALAAGDAVLFEAHRIPHYTTPLAPSAACPDPQRDVIVARYFIQSS